MSQSKCRDKLSKISSRATVAESKAIATLFYQTSCTAAGRWTARDPASLTCGQQTLNNNGSVTFGPSENNDYFRVEVTGPTRGR